MTILFLNLFFFGYAVFRMRRTIKSMNSTFHNEKFMRIHFVNVLIFTILYLIVCGLFYAMNTEEEKTIVPLMKKIYYLNILLIFIDVFSFYMDLFLIYLILRFTKPHLKVTGHDLVLGK